MAETTSSSRRSKGDAGANPGASQSRARSKGGADSGANGNGGRVSGRELSRAARETIAELAGLRPESVSGLQWDGETWLVTVDVCELERVPSTTDVMATYVVQLDEHAGLLGYKRTRRYQRGHAEEC